MKYYIKDQIKNDLKKGWDELLKDLLRGDFIKKKGKIYLWLDSYKYFAYFCVFVKDNMFYYPDHTVYPYFTPIFKKKDGTDFTGKQLGKYLLDFKYSPLTARRDKLEAILSLYKRKT